MMRKIRNARIIKIKIVETVIRCKMCQNYYITMPSIDAEKYKLLQIKGSVKHIKSLITNDFAIKIQH